MRTEADLSKIFMILTGLDDEDFEMVVGRFIRWILEEREFKGIGLFVDQNLRLLDQEASTPSTIAVNEARKWFSNGSLRIHDNNPELAPQSKPLSLKSAGPLLAKHLGWSLASRFASLYVVSHLGGELLLDILWKGDQWGGLENFMHAPTIPTGACIYFEGREAKMF